MKVQINTVISVLSVNGPIPKSDYRLQGKLARGRLETWVSVGTCTISGVLAPVIGSSGISPRPGKGMQKGPYNGQP